MDDFKEEHQNILEKLTQNILASRSSYGCCVYFNYFYLVQDHAENFYYFFTRLQAISLHPNLSYLLQTILKRKIFISYHL